MAPLVVLGCRVLPSAEGLRGALGRRVAEAAARWTPDRLVVTSGGRAWDGVAEATAMANELVRLGVDRADVVRELSSFNTWENALFTAKLLRARGIAEVALVTSEGHMPRAAFTFRRAGLQVVDTHPVAGGRRSLVGEAWERAKRVAWGG